eukprot:superscaffoldBa00000263_g3306
MSCFRVQLNAQLCPVTLGHVFVTMGMVTAPADRQTWTDGTGTWDVSFPLVKRSRPHTKNSSSSWLSALN